MLPGTLPRPTYPEALRATAPAAWRGKAAATLDYALVAHARHGRLAETAATLVTAARQTAHAVLAERGQWTTNEKRLLLEAGLRGVDVIVVGLRRSPRCWCGRSPRRGTCSGAAT